VSYGVPPSLVAVTGHLTEAPMAKADLTA